MPKLFPAFHKLNDRPIIIVGGGELATRKARLAYDASTENPEVSQNVSPLFLDGALEEEVVAPTPGLNFIWPSFEADVGEEWQGKAAFHHREPVEADFRGAGLVFVAIEDEALARKYGELARRGGAPVNVVDVPDASDFYTPSIIDRGEVVVAITTNGSAPVLGKKLRRQIEALLPARIGEFAEFARSFRDTVANKIAPDRRRRFWEQVVNGDISSVFLSGEKAEAQERMADAITAAAEGKKDARGVVHIVGAGPGDPELLTLKALRLIQDADVILYDRLVGDGILELARRDATRIFVGKSKSNHAVPQTDIHDKMVALANEGHVVVRLKGGDPFVFGRGGEELSALKAAGVAAFVTPGITAALGCGASAGLPMTHRDHAQAVTFVTGHSKSNAAPDLDWEALVRLRQTLVIYMGVDTAADISANLLRAGAAADLPVAIIENGTRPDEKVVAGRLVELAGLVAQHAIKGPAVLVIGENARFARQGLQAVTTAASAIAGEADLSDSLPFGPLSDVDDVARVSA